VNDTRVLPVHVEPRPHDVLVGRGLLDDLGELAAEVVPPGRCALVSDDHVAEHYLERAETSLRAPGFEPAAIVVPAGETTKSIAHCEQLWARFAEDGVDRSGCVFALGGGVVGDLAGFCAATWMRGVAVVQIPTTVLAMADAAIGGKTAVNVPDGKNLVGAFHQPSRVIADVETLATLPRRETAAGLAEVVKCAVLEDREALDRLRAAAPALLAADPDACLEAIALGAGTKVRIVTEDPLEQTGHRALLNLGHTAGHALEKVAGYGVVRHGEAVAIGMIVAARIAASRGLSPESLTATLVATLTALELPVALPDGVDTEAVLAATRLDKKGVQGVRRMVLPLADGGAGLFDVGDDELRAALR
jgi:3-dehydroquinate synthase